MKKERTIKLSCESARAFPIEKALAKLGHFPMRQTEKEAWFLSPFRPETQASFKVSKKLNRWYDHGAGAGGNVIDLIVAIKNCSVREALDFLVDGQDSFFFQRQPSIPSYEKAISVVDVRPIQHKALLDYIAQRNIEWRIVHPFCSEVHYTHNGKHYFAIGLPNDSNGWELRNKYCKNSTSPKDISHFKTGTDRLIITEGMFDLFSLICQNPSVIMDMDFLVLNSTSFVKKTIKSINNYASIELYLDNDGAGKRATAMFMESCENCTDRSFLYEGYNDLNEMWVGRKR